MPKTITLPRNKKYDPSAGVEITWTPSANRLDINGWYDHFVHIEGESISLSAFFLLLGITEKDCKKAFEPQQAMDRLAKLDEELEANYNNKKFKVTDGE